MEKETTTIKVSEDFVSAYLNFNVANQEEKIRALSSKERALLLILALDKHSDEDPVVVGNFLPFKDEVMEIYDVQDDKETLNESLLELIRETGDKYIDTDCIVDSSGEKLRNPYDKQEVREAKINYISEK
jgi:Fe-S-cluster formation regulator IscX/YfhJ